jgi:hypothetical protein
MHIDLTLHLAVYIDHNFIHFKIYSSRKKLLLFLFLFFHELGPLVFCFELILKLSILRHLMGLLMQKIDPSQYYLLRTTYLIRA